MTRYVHSLKLKDVPREEFKSVLKRLNAQHKVAEHYGVSQMTVSRHMRRLGISHDGKVESNRKKAAQHSKIMKQKFASGELEAPMKGKRLSKKHAEALRKSSIGKPAWNSGKGQVISVCETCGCNFQHPQARKRKFCSRQCSGVWVSKLHDSGRYKHIKQGLGKGGYHKGRWMRSSWEIEFAKKLDEAGINYLYEPRAFKLRNGKSYRPDFWIADKGFWVEVKGVWWPKAKEKFNMFLKEHPEQKIIVVQDELWNEELD
jgi:hypothetical protein